MRSGGPDVEQLELEIAEWRAFIGQDPALNGRDVEELETHLRDQIADLITVVSLLMKPSSSPSSGSANSTSCPGSSRASKAASSGDSSSSPTDGEQEQSDSRWLEALVFAVAAAATIQVARLAAGFPTEQASWLPLNASLFVLPFLAGYFARRSRLPLRQWLLTAIPFSIAAVVINVYPFIEGGSTELLVATHLPVALWFVVAYPYMSGIVRSHERRMDFVRFTGEWFIYYVLISLGGGVLLALTAFILEPTGVDAERVLDWVLPPAAAGAVIVAAWLVESKQRVVENMAPVLTMLFTPLFAVMLVAA